MEFQAFERIQESGWNLWSHQQKFHREFNSYNIELQSIWRQISILRFFSKNIKHIPAKYSLISFENSMKQSPTKFLDKFSMNQYLFIHDYLVKVIMYPKTMSILIGNFFSKDCVRLNFFARVTFPSLYHNFVTEELHKIGASLVKNIIHNQPFFISKSFFISFIEHSSDFLNSVWWNFENFVKENTRNDKMEHPEILSSVFLKSLSKSLYFLSKYQTELFQLLLNRSEKDFGTIVLHSMFPNSFVDYFQNKIKEPKQSAIYLMLQTASFYPKSPFFKNIAKIVTSPHCSKLRPYHTETGFMSQTPIVLSLHELFLIQQIIFNDSTIKSQNENSENETNSHKDHDILNNKKIITFKKKSGIFLFSSELCKNNLNPIYLDLNLSTFLTKSKDPVSINLFDDGNKKETSEFIRKFNAYLSSLYIEKVYRRLVHEKRLELFVTIGHYSKKCVDNSLSLHKPSSLFLPNSFNMVPNMLLIPSDTLSFSNVSFPTSFSISCLNQADYAFLKENENENDNNNSYINNEIKERKVQKVIDQLELNEDVKDKVTDLIEKFGIPNDEISMFILILELDLIKSQSNQNNNENEEEESNNDKSKYLDQESIIKFKGKIAKMNENYGLIVENSCLQKFIKTCTEKIGEMACKNHFRMIFELIIIGLELNEIAFQLSKGRFKNKNRIFEEIKPFINLVFLHSNNKMFDVLIWYHRFVNTFPEIRKVIPEKPRVFIEFLVDYF